MGCVDLVFICDNGYVLQTNVAIASAIFSKNITTNYEIHIVTTGLSARSKKLLHMHNSETVHVEIIEEELGELGILHRNKKGGHCAATPAALLKFRLPELLDKKKVLYLDGDVIIRCDLTELFDTDLTGFYAGAVVDSGSLYSQNPTVMKHPDYFNSGVMLMNLDKMREDNCTDKLIERKRVSTDQSLMDQHVLNDVLEGRVKFLPHRYNCLFTNLIRASLKFSIEQLNARYQENYTSLSDVAEKACIIHYSSKDKPWKYYDVPLAEEWYMCYLKLCNLYYLDREQIHRTSSPLAKNDRLYQGKYRPDIVVSLTSFPGRINTVHIPIIDMFEQTVRADHVILWLAKTQFPSLDEDLPETLTALCARGLKIRWCDEDLRSHKKYFYAMQEYPDCIVITIDDDLRYSPYMIEKLLESYKRYPNAVSAMRVHLMLRDPGDSTRIAPYSEWKQEYSKWLLTPSMQLFATSGAGTLFPPYCLSAEVFNKQTILETCLYADDIWLKLAQVMQKTQVVLADIHQRLVTIDGTQEEALWRNNVTNRGNDSQLSDLLSKYNDMFGANADTLVSRIFFASPHPNRNKTPKSSRELALENELQNAEQELANIQNSISFRLGRFITFIPRKIRGGIRCYREHGLRYTLKRVKEHLHL